MFSKLPSLFFGTAYSISGSAIAIPFAALPELTTQEGHAATGDSREIVYALLAKVNDTIQALPQDDRPTKMVCTRSNGSVRANGTFDVTFSVQFTRSLSGSAMADE
jgi:hypothetical protein